MSNAIDAKRRLRREMRRLRRTLPGTRSRTEALWERVWGLDAVRSADVLMAYAAVPGEPDATSFVDRCRAAGIEVVVPAADPIAPPPPDPARLDVIVVPGLAFTVAGDRLGQGGGWFDRVLASVRPDCHVVGVCFHEQIVPDLPIEAHDVRVDVVATDRALHVRERTDPPD